MARDIETGLGYIPLDLNFFGDRKIRRLQRKCDADAPMVYIALLCTIYREGYYLRWDEDFSFDLADAIHKDEEYVSGVIRACLEIGLLSQEMFEKHHVLTSVGIQRQYNCIGEKSRRKARVNEYSLLINAQEYGDSAQESPEEVPEQDINVAETALDVTKMQQSKIKESKLKESKVNISSPLSSSPEGEEETKEKIVSYFTFEKNWLSPNKEYENLVAYYSGPEAKVKWRDMSEEDKVSLRTRWRQLPEQPPRFAKASLSAWKSVYETLCSLGAPLDVRMDALSDDVTWYGINGTLMLVVSERLYRYIEVPPDPDTPPRLGRFKPYLRQLMKSCGCKELSYDYGERN